MGLVGGPAYLVRKGNECFLVLVKAYERGVFLTVILIRFVTGFAKLPNVRRVS